MKKIVIIVGPTASGKSNYAVALAKKINGEIISADSRQVYRGLDIGSGKITKKEMCSILHHCLDIASPKKVFTVQDFKTYGERAIATILKKNKTPIIVGGTGFYIDVLLGRVQTASVPTNPKLRKVLEKKSVHELFLILKKLDPEHAKTIDPHNPRRLIRAIEIVRSRETIPLVHHEYSPAAEFLCSPTRIKNSMGSAEVHKQIGFSSCFPLLTKEGLGEVVWLGIKRSPEELKKRIHRRLIKRLSGIIREVKKLHQQGISWKRLYDLGLEYRFGSLYVQKKLTKQEFQNQLETASWHYARRQMTWWRRNKQIYWIENEKDIMRLLK